jgi:hypothetical protein
MKSKSQQKPKDYNAILGLLRLFVVASIAYTSTVIVMGTDGVTPLVLTAPQVIWAIAILVKQFSK